MNTGSTRGWQNASSRLPMRAKPAFRLLLAGLILPLAGCFFSNEEAADELQLVESAPPMPTTPLPARQLPPQAIVDRTLDPSLESYVDLHADEIADNDLVVFQLRLLLTDQGEVLAEALHRRNPDLIILADLQVLSVPNFWNLSSQRERFPFSAELYDLLHPRLARTTTGDVPLMWSDAPMVNPLRDGELDEELQEEMLGILVRNVTEHPGTFDGFFHDYMSPAPWMWPSPEEAGIGAVDLDGDQIAFADDPQEQAAWIGWQRRLLRRLQELFGEGLIQTANGRLPLDDPQTAQLLAGIWIQHFPKTVWGNTELEGLQMALDHVEGGVLTPRRGHYWSIYSSETAGRDGNIAFRRFTSYLTGQFYVYRKSQDGDFVGRDPSREELGAPLGGVKQSSDAEGNLVFERPFETAVVRMVLDPSGFTRSLAIEPNPAKLGR